MIQQKIIMEVAIDNMKKNINETQDCFIKIGTILDSLDAQVNELCPVNEAAAIFQLEKEALAEIQQQIDRFGLSNFFEQEG
ncbi:hypothetical protein ACYSNW_02440 [Enterococcus sp. LJL99]